MPLTDGAVVPAAALFALAMAGDIHSRTIPNWISVALFVVFAAGSIVGGVWTTLLDGMAAALVVFGGGLLAFRIGALGGGDVKLMSATAMGVGLDQLPTFLLATALFGGMLALGFLAAAGVQRLFRAENTPGQAMPGQTGIPYAVAIGFGFAFVCFAVPT